MGRTRPTEEQVRLVATSDDMEGTVDKVHTPVETLARDNIFAFCPRVEFLYYNPGIFKWG
uniref:Uncharacterized protein n=1 Tax=Candidatus Kentrum sp. TUN TaxID=2126343 RepID=A0A451A4V2_9GAMM|nr:MAG: hypothetical protein BECKTUN1418F_GA0071002_106311 [Candidatus Kentron sp. TUN]VFK61070.1 MAG: hypothetical protein BECKTUN1418E_GA0071001_106111 [Candidatus Kentron sp. TUN]